MNHTIGYFWATLLGVVAGATANAPPYPNSPSSLPPKPHIAYRVELVDVCYGAPSHGPRPITEARAADALRESAGQGYWGKAPVQPYKPAPKYTIDGASSPLGARR